MSVKTGGKIRGLIGRWLMRFEAAAKIFQVTFLGITAASTLTSALSDIGFAHYTPHVLGLGVVGSPVFAYVYVEYGLFNRKNREHSERGKNYSRPDMRIDDEMIAAGVYAAVHKQPPDEQGQEAIEQAVDETYQKHRNGVEIK